MGADREVARIDRGRLALAVGVASGIRSASRDRDVHEYALPAVGDHVDGAADGTDTVAHVPQPDAVSRLVDIKTPAVVAHLKVEPIGLNV
jgi:hypothetical protein